MKCTPRFLAAAAATAIILFSGCSTTHQADSVTRSGFLGSYAQLTPGKDGQTLLRYVNPNAPWRSYNKIMIDAVYVYARKDSDLVSANKEEQAALANYFGSTLIENLRKDYQIVNTPGPGVMRIRAAITDADESEVLLNTVTTILPIGLALSTMKRVVTGSDSFVGSAQAELEILDSLSGRRLGAFVDKRYGTKALRSKFGAYNDAKAAFDNWAERLAEKLAQARKGEL